MRSCSTCWSWRPRACWASSTARCAWHTGNGCAVTAQLRCVHELPPSDANTHSAHPGMRFASLRCGRTSRRRAWMDGPWQRCSLARPWSARWPEAGLREESGVFEGSMAAAAVLWRRLRIVTTSWHSKTHAVCGLRRLPLDAHSCCA
jgi:hypothetical protein